MCPFTPLLGQSKKNIILGGSRCHREGSHCEQYRVRGLCTPGLICGQQNIETGQYKIYRSQTYIFKEMKLLFLPLFIDKNIADPWDSIRILFNSEKFYVKWREFYFIFFFFWTFFSISLHLIVFHFILFSVHVWI